MRLLNLTQKSASIANGMRYKNKRGKSWPFIECALILYRWTAAKTDVLFRGQLCHGYLLLSCQRKK